MPIFAILAILSITMYIFYKVKFFKSKLVIEKQWISSKSRIALGLFVLFYGINQLVMWETQTAKIIGIVFLLFGAFSAIMGYKSYRYYLPLAIKEAEENNK